MTQIPYIAIVNAKNGSVCEGMTFDWWEGSEFQEHRG
jgi:hypothetical protein